ncbi:hypothetical protein [Acerihabitans arboris]|uniref:Uncharacterized protein n=1 Tax=Acerihabitans arboris TaxID=2691583 RepID=A0A845SIE7_9GAMM|nr:hypothetical protein [Acerihabitans arboris]NDL64923.1 hypothetical protein [Acerihabitans arboris]
MSDTITITDPLPGQRVYEPVIFTIKRDLADDLWLATADGGEQVLCQRLAAGSGNGRTRLIATVSFAGRLRLTLDRPCTVEEAAQAGGIQVLTGKEADCFARLDTGAFDLELCHGSAQGVGSSKWGIRHFRAVEDGFELLPSGNNAIGGFYGPFFTPENGLINPPEHTRVTIETVECGPVLHHYRMHGQIPDGLLPELRGKRFTIDWQFTYNTPFFQRRYRVDSFQTLINGRSVTDKITVGDEFEGGAGALVFDRFAAYGGTRYRAGDPYAGELVAMVADTVANSANHGPKFEEFRARLADMASAHWDLYWRLFCAWEKVLDEDELQERLARVRARAHVSADMNNRPWILTDRAVDVSAVPHETIFPGPASKTVEYHQASGRAMVWWTSQPSGAFQIVQRRQSGWVNWGTNGENECPELPTGVEIKTAYGRVAERWTQVADQLETPPVVTVDKGDR